MPIPGGASILPSTGFGLKLAKPKLELKQEPRKVPHVGKAVAGPYPAMSAPAKKPAMDVDMQPVSDQIGYVPAQPVVPLVLPAEAGQNPEPAQPVAPVVLPAEARAVAQNRESAQPVVPVSPSRGMCSGPKP